MSGARSTRQADRAVGPTRDACTTIRHELDRGAPWNACDTFRAASRDAHADATLFYWGALAHARVGAIARAHALLDAAQRASPPRALVPEILSLRGRLWKDEARRTAPGTSEHDRAVRAARDEYRHAHEVAGGAYPAVNAATLSMLLGERDDARRGAREAIARLASLRRLPGVWEYATRGEAELLLGHFARARRSYAAAYARASHDPGVIATMRRQLGLLSAAMPQAVAMLAEVPAASVVAFVGHMVDPPDAREPRFPAELEPAVTAAIRARLAGPAPPIAYTSAACGADIAFIEVAHAMGAEVNIVLPFDREDFVRTSVAFGGPRWTTRFEHALARAARVIMATEEGYLGDDVLFDYAATLVEGLAMLRAAQLETAPRLLAVLDAKAEGGVGGARASFERWQQHGGALEIIDLRRLRREAARRANGRSAARRPVRSRAADTEHSMSVGSARTRPERGLKTLLFADFAGYSRLHDAFAPLFQRHFLEIGAQQVATSAAPPLEMKTWGDALYGVFAAPREGADFAWGLLARMLDVDWTKAGMPDTSQIRIALHAGPVFGAFDPIMGRHSYFGSNVTRAARIEPITPPGMIYVSEAFAAALRASGERAYALEYVGMLPLAKDYGASRIYRLDRG